MDTNEFNTGRREENVENTNEVFEEVKFNFNKILSDTSDNKTFTVDGGEFELKPLSVYDEAIGFKLYMNEDNTVNSLLSSIYELTNLVKVPYSTNDIYTILGVNVSDWNELTRKQKFDFFCDDRLKLHLHKLLTAKKEAFTEINEIQEETKN